VAWQGPLWPLGGVRSLEVLPNACGRVWSVQMRKISRKSAAAQKAPSRRWGAWGWSVGWVQGLV
jgi:hypothetical protein